MFNKHKAVVGNTTASDAEIKQFMLQRAITSYQAQCGIVPQIMIESDNLPRFTFRLRRVNAVSWYRVNDTPHGRLLHRRFGGADELTIECVEPLCYDCAYSIRAYLKFNAYVHSNSDNQKCCFCEQRCHDPIPF